MFKIIKKLSFILLIMIMMFPTVMLSVLAEDNVFSLSDGVIWIKKGTMTDTINVWQGGIDHDNISDKTQITITGSYSLSSNTGTLAVIRVEATANIKLSNVNINCQNGLEKSSAFSIGIDRAPNVMLELEGENILRSSYGAAGLRVCPSASVTIFGVGSLSAYAGYGSAGIGGQRDETNGEIIINSGTITATSGGGGAGIGGGDSVSGGVITINGGTVNATATSGGLTSGAGIGGGRNGGKDGSSNVITINDGIVTATGVSSGAGIGGGGNASGGIIRINGGTVTATGGNSGGTGIGSNVNGAGSIIEINGGNITAAGGDPNGHGYGAGIGGGWYMYNGSVLSDGSEITITRGVITATGGRQGAGIGGCYLGSGGKIEISGGVVTAIGGRSAADIGGGSEGADGTFTMNGNAVVFASRISDTDISRRTSGILNFNKFYSTDITITDDLTIPTSWWVTIPSGITLTIPSHLTLTNNGTVTPADGSTITVEGTVLGNKIGGANVEKPIISGIPTETSITVNPVNLLATTGQDDVEYAVSMLGYADPETLVWQSNTTLPLKVTGEIFIHTYEPDKASVEYITPRNATIIIAFYKDGELLDLYKETDNELSDTTFYVFARSKENTNFSSGWISASDEIITKQQSVSGSIYDIDIPTGANKIKVMIWDNLDIMQPICNYKEVEYNDSTWN